MGRVLLDGRNGRQDAVGGEDGLDFLMVRAFSGLSGVDAADVRKTEAHIQLALQHHSHNVLSEFLGDQQYSGASTNQLESLRGPPSVTKDTGPKPRS